MEKKSKKELEQLVKDLESELEAAMRREELLLNPVGGSGKLKQKIKRTKLGRIAADPNSKVGKIVRSPRTIYRLIIHPSIIREMRAEKQKGQESSNDSDRDGNKPIFVPIKFFQNRDINRRVNVVSEKFDTELTAAAVEIANKKDMELRIVTYGEGADPMQYNRAVEKKKLNKAKKISFYSSVDQNLKNKVFELEVGDGDIFITRAWNNDEE